MSLRSHWQLFPVDVDQSIKPWPDGVENGLMDRDAIFLRVVWRLLWIATAAGGFLDFGLDVLAKHWHLPFAFLAGAYVPYALFSKVHNRCHTPRARTASLVCGTTGLGVLVGVCIAFPFSEFRPTGWVALIYVVWTLPLFVFLFPPMAIDYFAARAEAKFEAAVEDEVEAEVEA